jgi:hypothetical protein
MKLPLILQRLTLVALFVAACPAAGWAQVDATFSGTRAIEVLQVPSSIPEHRRAEYLTMLELLRDLRRPPLFPHQALSILQDVKVLENRPEGRPSEWAEPLGPRLAEPLGLIDRLGPARAALVLATRNLTPDEFEVRSGAVERKLINLAVTGRITKEEFEGFVMRWRGN